MKQPHVRNLLGAVVLALLMAPGLAPGQPQVPVARLTTGDWLPYVGRDQPGHGTCARIVTAVLREMGLEPQYLFLPWSQALAEAERSGGDQIRGTFPYIHTLERERSFYLSTPVLTVETVLFYSTDHHPELAALADLTDLADLTAVLSSGHAYPEELQAVMGTTVEEENEVRAFRRLLEDAQVHFLPAARRVGEAVLERHFPARGFEVAVIDSLSWHRDLHLLASRRNPHSWQFVQSFDAALTRLQRSGAIDQIILDDAGGEVRPDLVELTAAAGEAIAATPVNQPRSRLLLPTGGRAVVLNWGPAYRDHHPGEPDSVLRACRVRLLSGPARGQVVDVDGRHLRLLQEGAR